jgi:hypothetical protein
MPTQIPLLGKAHLKRVAYTVETGCFRFAHRPLAPFLWRSSLGIWQPTSPILRRLFSSAQSVLAEHKEVIVVENDFIRSGPFFARDPLWKVVVPSIAN